MKRYALPLLLMLLVPAAGASTITHETVLIELGEPSHVTVQRQYTAETDLGQVSYLIPGRYDPRQIQTSATGVACRSTQLESGTEVTCDASGMTAVAVNISFRADLTTGQDGATVGAYSQRIVSPTEDLTVRMVLPEGFGLVEGDDPYRPGNATVGTEGRRIFVEWTDPDPQLADVKEYRVRYEELTPFEQLPALLLGTTVLVSAAVIAAAFLLVRRRRDGGEDGDTIASMFPVLKDDERDVVRYIIDHEGEVEQREIVDELDYSKAKISHLLSDLADRSLVEKEKVGRVNIVRLARDVGDLEP